MHIHSYQLDTQTYYFGIWNESLKLTQSKERHIWFQINWMESRKMKMRYFNSSFKQNKLWTFQGIMIILNHAKIELEAIIVIQMYY